MLAQSNKEEQEGSALESEQYIKQPLEERNSRMLSPGIPFVLRALKVTAALQAGNTPVTESMSLTGRC